MMTRPLPYTPYFLDSFYVHPEDQVVEHGSQVTLECIPKDLRGVLAVLWAFIDLTRNPSRLYNIVTNDTARGYYLVPHGEETRWRDLVIPSMTDRHETGYQCLVYKNTTDNPRYYYSDVAELVIHGEGMLELHARTHVHTHAP